MQRQREVVDRTQQVRLPDAVTAPDNQRVICLGGRLGNDASRCMRKAVRLCNNEIREIMTDRPMMSDAGTEGNDDLTNHH